MHLFNSSEELRVGVHGRSKNLAPLQQVAYGDAKYNIRSKYLETARKEKGSPALYSLSPEEQVACLIDQATDANVLGRTWQGWEPWV